MSTTTNLEKIFNDEGVLVKETWSMNGGYHRVDGPAYREWNDEGVQTSEEWMLNGKCHRTDGPARRGWSECGVLEHESWYMHDKLHRSDGPAMRYWMNLGDDYGGPEWFLMSEEWFLYGNKHRVDGPAYRSYCCNELDEESWYLHGMLHRTGGPAHQCWESCLEQRCEIWYLNGKKHRTDGPAYLFWSTGEDSHFGQQDDIRQREKLIHSHYYFEDKKVNTEEHRRYQVLDSGRAKVLRAARLLHLIPVVLHLPNDILSVVGEYLR